MGAHYIVLPRVMKESLIAHIEATRYSMLGYEKIRNFCHTRALSAWDSDMVRFTKESRYGPLSIMHFHFSFCSGD